MTSRILERRGDECVFVYVLEREFQTACERAEGERASKMNCMYGGLGLLHSKLMETNDGGDDFQHPPLCQWLEQMIRNAIFR